MINAEKGLAIAKPAVVLVWKGEPVCEVNGSHALGIPWASNSQDQASFILPFWESFLAE
jgi:hypothetical protein